MTETHLPDLGIVLAGASYAEMPTRITDPKAISNLFAKATQKEKEQIVAFTRAAGSRELTGARGYWFLTYYTNLDTGKKSLTAGYSYLESAGLSVYKFRNALGLKGGANEAVSEDCTRSIRKSSSKGLPTASLRSSTPSPMVSVPSPARVLLTEVSLDEKEAQSATKISSSAASVRAMPNVQKASSPNKQNKVRGLPNKEASGQSREATVISPKRKPLTGGGR